MAIETYSEKLCNEKHANIEKNFQNVSKILDSHDDEIKGIKDNYTKEINEIKEAIIELKQISKMLAEKQYKNGNRNMSFWETKAGGRIMTFIFIISSAIVTAAVGVNIMSHIP